MSIRVDCPCGATLHAYDVFAGGQVKCALCGQMVTVPDSSQSVDKIRFACPHCNTRVVGRLASVGKSSRCPACGKTYVIPKPALAPVSVSAPMSEPEPSAASFAHRHRIRINPEDVAFYGEALADLERKTELPTDDDTVRPPTRPVVPRLQESDDPVPLFSYTLPVHPDVRFSPFRSLDHDDEVNLPPVSIPADELRLAETLLPGEVSEQPASLLSPPDRSTDVRSKSPSPLVGEGRGGGAIATRGRGDAETRGLRGGEGVTGRGGEVTTRGGADAETRGRANEPASHDRDSPSPARLSSPQALVGEGRGGGHERPSNLILPINDDTAQRASAAPAPRQDTFVSVVPPLLNWSSRSLSGLRASLVFVDGESAGKTVQLTSRNFLIGRERDCQFRPRCHSVSHHHCVLKTDLFSVRIRDLGSRNGTFVNGHRIHQEVILHHSDNVRIGDLRFKIDIPDDLYARYHSADAQLSLDEFVIL
ncbi:MAG: FHA domain-containing protein [Planctomycetaceae bacterium]